MARFFTVVLFGVGCFYFPALFLGVPLFALVIFLWAMDGAQSKQARPPSPHRRLTAVEWSPHLTHLDMKCCTGVGVGAAKRCERAAARQLTATSPKPLRVAPPSTRAVSAREKGSR
jgi:hypothetical protein